jgi:hypothetical protein
MKHRDRFLSVILRRHFHEAKTTGTARGTILHDVHGENGTRLGKMILQIIFCGGEREITDE